MKALLLLFSVGTVQIALAVRENFCPRRCIRGVQQFPFGEICICPEFCPMFCCQGYYYHAPIPGSCPTTCGQKSRPIDRECCFPGGFSDYQCIAAQKRWFDKNTKGVWWWPAVFNDSSSTSTTEINEPWNSLSLVKSTKTVKIRLTNHLDAATALSSPPI